MTNPVEKQIRTPSSTRSPELEFTAIVLDFLTARKECSYLCHIQIRHLWLDMKNIMNCEIR